MSFVSASTPRDPKMTELNETLKIDLKKCIKAGECYYNHPELFKATKSAYPVILVGHPSTEREIRAANEAVEVCPSGAISFGEG
jgi:ferredoxin